MPVERMNVSPMLGEASEHAHFRLEEREKGMGGYPASPSGAEPGIQCISCAWTLKATRIEVLP
jgi:hypothetical protein